jgi:hypothetical protein
MEISKRRVEITLKIFAVLVRIFLYSVIPFTLTLLSTFYIRYIPTVYGNVCGPAGDDFCYKPLPRAGFPFAYWMDQGGISVMGQLGFEDELSVLAFGADFFFYLLLVFAVDKLVRGRGEF